MVEKINAKLEAKGCTWKLSRSDPRYKTEEDGALAAYSNKNFRRKRFVLEKEEWKRENPAPSIEDPQSRIPPSEREKRYASRNPIPPEKGPLPWSCGSAVWHHQTEHDNASLAKEPYLQAVNTVEVPVVAGISGTSDRIVTGLNAMGFSSDEELQLARLACAAWMVDGHNHSITEVATALRAFGIDFTIAPDYYRQLAPASMGQFVEKVRTAQRKRGLELPDYYLSEKGVQAVAKELETRSSG